MSLASVFLGGAVAMLALMSFFRLTGGLIKQAISFSFPPQCVPPFDLGNLFQALPSLLIFIAAFIYSFHL